MHRKMMFLIGTGVFCVSTLAHADVVKLEQGEARALLGNWEGDYTCDTGYRGRSTLNLTEEAGHGRIDGFFEYRYGGSTGGRYDRHPDQGTITGVIKPDGRLHFGSWDLTLQSTSGNDYAFTTRQRLAGYPCDLTWRRNGVNLGADDRHGSESSNGEVLVAAPSSVPLPQDTRTAGADGFALTGLKAPESVQVSEFYTISFRYDAADAPSIKRVCFPAAGGAANCWDRFTLDPATKNIRTSSRIDAPGTYTLTGYVEYESDGGTHESNQVSTLVTVR